VGDGLEISLIKGNKNGVELEADDNLQDAVSLTWNGSTLILSAAKEVYDFKKFNIRVTYTDSFKTATSKGKSKINALEEVTLDDIAFRSFDNSKMFLNLAAKSFKITGDDRSKIELNAKSESGSITLSKNAEIKALVSATELKCDLYQKAAANIEGDVIDMTLRLDNNSGFTGKKLTVKNMKLIAEGYSSCNVSVETAIRVEASGTSEIQLYGDPKIDLAKFADSAVLSKKPSK
jgi:hypothetical protein